MDGVLFTGGAPAGLAIHRALAGQPEKILALELGGNNPLIAWDVANVQAAARIVVLSAFVSAGQRCTCARRLIVPADERGKAILNAVLDAIARLRVGSPDAQPQPFMGPLISPAAASEVLAQQAALIARGAQALIACAAAETLGPAYLTPGLIDVTNAAGRPDAEIFGPLLQVICVADFETALREANATRFGLAAGLISDSPALFERFSDEIRAGVVNWNRQTTGASGAAPFGGVGLSGNHRPAGFYAADYCAWPMANLIAEGPLAAADAAPGLDDE